jgi:magnesium transporter
MSEFSMITGPENWKMAYPLFLLGMAVIGVGTYFVIRRLEKRDKEKD